VANIIQFPGTRQTALQRVQSSYSLRDVQKQFGISEKLLRKWAEAGAVETVPGKEGEIRFGLGALARFRSIREERTRGKTLKQIDEEMRGQLDLFASRPSGIVRSLSEKRTPFEEGLILLDRGDASAASFFQKALEQDDHRADAHCNLGILAFESGDVPGAMTEFIRALESEPGHFESHYDLGNLYFDAGNLPLAQMHFETAARIEPEYADTFYNLGLLYARLENWKKSKECFERYTAFEDTDHGEAVKEILKHLEQQT
jgi:tetratricopeptide (TPR) repeat protein